MMWHNKINITRWIREVRAQSCGFPTCRIGLDNYERAIEVIKTSILSPSSYCSICYITSLLQQLCVVFFPKKIKYSIPSVVKEGFECMATDNKRVHSHIIYMMHIRKMVEVFVLLIIQVDVNGSKAAPLYKYLKSSKGGLLGDDIKWNFSKFLVDKDGKVVDRYAPTTSPLSIEVKKREPFM